MFEQQPIAAVEQRLLMQVAVRQDFTLFENTESLSEDFLLTWSSGDNSLPFPVQR